jgi:NAD(P)-dependent dehydrogenase (short-subunit alcohol dehydrogenase family)
MSRQLEGRVCIVTGSGSGMGRASAQEMARRGGRVVVTDVSVDAGQHTVELINQESGEATFIRCDLRDKSQIQELMDGAARHYGGIDVLHNNAAVHETDLTDKTSIEELDEAVWDLVYEINLKAIWLTVKAAVPYLKASSSPSVINVASTGAFVAYPMAGCYCATKGGVLMLTKAMAVDLAKYDIRVNCYCPGAIDTPMMQKYLDAAEDKDAIMHVLTGAHLIPRLGKADEIAKLACFLASDESSFITGASYVIDGGTLAWRGTRV